MFILGTILTAPWFIGVSLKHPFFLSFFFIHEHVARFLTTVHHREAPFYFFVPVLLGGFLPWSVFLYKVGDRWLRQPGRTLKKEPETALLVIWSILVFVFFSVSQSKLFAYVLPIYPAIALLVALEFDEACDQSPMPLWLGHGLAGLIGIFLALLLIFKWPRPAAFLTDPLFQAVVGQSGPLALVLGIGVFVFVGVWGMRRALPAFGGIVLVQVLFLSTLSVISIQLDPLLSTRTLADVVRERSQPSDRVIVYGMSYENHAQTFPFYAKRRVAVFGEPGELDLGSRHAEDAAVWFTPEAMALEALTHEPMGTWGLTDEEHWNQLQQSPAGSLFDKIIQEGKFLLFQKTS
jgi:4-amino-4-deoxy-L-arabinose transferase-like glycosyltransferase